MIDPFKKKTFKEWLRDNIVGIYITAIFHLTLMLVLSINQLRVKSSARFMAIEFEYQALMNNEKSEEELLAEKEALEKELDELLKTVSHPSVNLPNIAVSQTGSGSETGTRSNASIRDVAVVADRSNVKSEQTRQESTLEENRDAGIDEVNVPQTANQEKPGDEYKGPSILSYFLEGRHGVYLPVPAYKCHGGGDVIVIIEVNRKGYVTSAEVDRKRSSGDECVRDAALQAALASRFSQSVTSEEHQKGNIVYRFIPQAR
jgi:TonB family protein